METQNKTAEILNDLIQINNDRIEGYNKAIKELEDKDADLKTLFANMIGESHQYKLALAQEVEVFKKDVDTDSTTNLGKIYRTWMDIKALFTGHDRKTVLSNCEFGEDAAQKAYKEALEEKNLPEFIKEIILKQKDQLKLSHNKIKQLRDMQK